MSSKREIESAEVKPQVCLVVLEDIPQELKERPQWVLFEYRRRKGRWTKVPVQPGGKEAKADDPRTWRKFEAVANYVRADGTMRRYDGIGFEFAEDDLFCGIDLDDAIDMASGAAKPWAAEIVQRLNSYTELSPSKTGLKVWVRAKKPDNEHCRAKIEDGEVELYDRARYFVTTGQHWPGTPKTIEERQAELDALYYQLFPKQVEKELRQKRMCGPQPETRSLSDDELIRNATAAKNGGKIARLMNGDTSAYDDDASRADLALCLQLAFWSGRDPAQMDRIFRTSNLMRSNWDEKRGDSTYGQRTIARACAECQETFRGDGPRIRRRTAISLNGSSTNGDGHSNNGDTNGHCKPTIVLDTDEFRVNNEAIAVLSDPVAAPEVFQRGNTLARVLRTKKAGKQSRVDRPEGTPRITPMPPAHLCELLTRVADFFKKKETRDGEILIPAHPPDRTIAAVLARGHYPEIRGLEAVIEAPTLRPDGTILDTPGWDAETGLLYEPNADFPPILQIPTRVEAMIAADCLLELVRDFAFAGETQDTWLNHRAAWLSGLLTVLARFAIDGCCPLFLFDANCPGTGKTLLSDIIGITATGRSMSRTAFPNDEAELRKCITSIAIVGDRLMLFDNIPAGCPFGGAALDAALTGTTWRDRVLGKSEMTPELPLHTVFFATGNNVVLKGDVQRRVIPCRLETQEERPEERAGFKYPDLAEYVRAHRPQLVSAGLTILRAFVVAGRPQAPLPPFGSYEAWSRLIRQAVFWVMGADPFSTRETMRAADPALSTLAALLEGWAELPGGRTGISVAEALRILNNPESKDDHAVLRGALMEWSRNDKLPGSGTIGHKLRSLRKRVIDGRMLDSATGHGGGQRWRVVGLG